MQNDLLFSAPQKWVNDTGTITVLWLLSEGDIDFDLGRLIVQKYTRDSCIVFSTEEGNKVVKAVLRGADYLTNRGYTLQPEEPSPPLPPALTALRVEGGPPINWGDIN